MCKISQRFIHAILNLSIFKKNKISGALQRNSHYIFYTSQVWRCFHGSSQTPPDSEASDLPTLGYHNRFDNECGMVVKIRTCRRPIYPISFEDISI